MLLKIPGPPNGPTHLPNSHFSTNTLLELTFFIFHLREEGGIIYRNNVATEITQFLLNYMHICLNHTPTSTVSIYPSPPLSLSSFLSQASLSVPPSFLLSVPLSWPAPFHSLPWELSPCMSSVAIRRKGLDERCFSGPRPPHLWMETIEPFFMSRWPHTNTHPPNHTHTHCQETFYCPAAVRARTLHSHFRERVYYITKPLLLIAVFDCFNYCCGKDNITWVQVSSQVSWHSLQRLSLSQDHVQRWDVAKSKPNQSRMGPTCGDKLVFVWSNDQVKPFVVM